MELLEALHNTSHVASTSELKSIAYYQMLYVRQGKSGLFRDSACYEMLQRDAYAAQEALAPVSYTHLTLPTICSV